MYSPALSSLESPVRTIQLADRLHVPVLGQGTWRMGEDPGRREQETAAIRLGVELGMTLIDTAEMYGEGATESWLGEALAGLRNQVQLVSKACPQNAGRGRLERACEASLRRLRTDHLDLYLLHWRGGVPLADTVEGLEALVAAGKIRKWGVSNFDVADIRDLVQAGGSACAANQVLYNVTRRGPEFDLLAALTEQGVAAMAYSPVEQGQLPAGGALAEVAQRRSCTNYQVALAWTLRLPGMISIPKAATETHVRDNRAAADLELSAEDLAAIDAEFAPPRRKVRLAIL